MNEFVKRQNVLRIVQHRLDQEEALLKAAKTEYQKRVISRTVAMLRDLKEMFEQML